MSQTNLQAAWESKTAADDAAKAAAAKVADLQSQLAAAQDDAKSRADAAADAEKTLETGAGAVPQNKLVKTSDGKYLVAFGGVFHEYEEVDASAVSYDDGKAAPDVNPIPTPDVHPGPVPAPGPSPEPSPDVNPIPSPEPAPDVAPLP